MRSLLLAAVIFVFVSAIGFTTGNTTGLALNEVREVSGSGSALLGAAQFLFGALIYASDRFHPGSTASA